MRNWLRLATLAVIALASGTTRADDLGGSDRFLCTALRVTACSSDGECAIDLPSSLNVPQFIEVDLAAKRLATTKASGEDRATPIENLRRNEGKIVIQGYESQRAFSIVITEATGELTAAVAREGTAVAVFGACTPLSR